MLPPDKVPAPSKAGHPAPAIVPSQVLAEAGQRSSAALAGPPSMTSLLHALRLCWGRVLVLAVLAAAAGAGIAWLVVPGQFVAQTLLHVSSRPARGSWEADSDFTHFQRTQSALVKSRGVIEKALRDPKVSALAEVQAHPDPVAWLEKALVADFTLGPELLRVSLGGERSDDVAVILNVVSDAYLAEVQTRDRDRVRVRMVYLRQTQEQNKKDLGEKREELRRQLKEHNLEDPRTRTVRLQANVQAAQARKTDLERQRLTVELDLRGARAELSTLEARVSGPVAVDVPYTALDEEIRNDPTAKKHLEALARAEEYIRHVERVAKPELRPEMLRSPLADRKSIQAALDQLREEARARVERRLQGRKREELREGVARLKGQVKRNEEMLRELDARLSQADALIQAAGTGPQPLDRAAEEVLKRVERLADEVTELEAVAKKVGNEVSSLQAENPVIPPVTRLQAAAPPTSRKIDRQLKAAGGAGVGLFGLVVVGLALWESRSRRVFAAEDVVENLGLNVVGTLPMLPPAALARAVPAEGADGAAAEGHAPMTEAIDGVRTLLLHTPRGRELRVIMVTSALGGEGKTTLASHLAASLARSWRKTLLIDCDLRNPAAHRQFDQPSEPGFCEALRGEVEFEDAVRPTAVSRLWLLPAGRCDSYAIQALAQEGLASVFARFKEEYEFVVIDTAPVLPVADSLLVAPHADAVLFSILRDVSRMTAVHAAQQRLAAVGVATLGAVVIGEKTASYGPAVAYPRATVS